MPAKLSTPLKNAREAAILRELAIDFDWSAAAKRAGLTKKQLDTLLKDEKFLQKGEELINKGTAGLIDIEEANKKFQKTQSILMDALNDGDFSVASSLMKSHEMEFRRFGLFEKDNKQKGQAVQINISLDNSRDSDTINVIEQESDDENNS